MTKLMKLSIALVFGLIFTLEANAKVIGIEENRCYPSYPFGYVIVGKIDTGIYEMRGMSRIIGTTQKAFLKTHGTQFKGQGGFHMFIKHMGTKTIKSDNGFDEPYEFWEECNCGKDKCPKGFI